MYTFTDFQLHRKRSKAPLFKNFVGLGGVGNNFKLALKSPRTPFAASSPLCVQRSKEIADKERLLLINLLPLLYFA